MYERTSSVRPFILTFLLHRIGRPKLATVQQPCQTAQVSQVLLFRRESEIMMTGEDEIVITDEMMIDEVDMATIEGAADLHRVVYHRLLPHLDHAESSCRE